MKRFWFVLVTLVIGGCGGAVKTPMNGDGGFGGSEQTDGGEGGLVVPHGSGCMELDKDCISPSAPRICRGGNWEVMSNPLCMEFCPNICW